MAAKWQQWMPFHIDRWKGSAYVQAMHPAARDGYLYLLSAQWQSDDCTLPDDDEELAVLSGLASWGLWEQFAKVIRRQFVSVDGRLQNKVLHAAWEEAKHIFEARKSAAGRTNQRSPLSHVRATDTVTVTVSDAVTERSPSRSADTITETVTETEKHVSKAKAFSPRHVEDVYAAYPRKVGKHAALKAISKALKTLSRDGAHPDDAFALLLERTEAFARSPAAGGEFVPHPATWFNQGRYCDDPQEWEHGKRTRADERLHSVAASYTAAEQRIRDMGFAAVGATGSGDGPIPIRPGGVASGNDGSGFSAHSPPRAL